MLWWATECPSCCSYPAGAVPRSATATVGMEKQGCRVTVVQIPRSTTLPGTALNTTTAMPCVSQELSLGYSVVLAYCMSSCPYTRGRCLSPSEHNLCYLPRVHSSFDWGASWSLVLMLQLEAVMTNAVTLQENHILRQEVYQEATVLLSSLRHVVEGTTMAWPRWLTCP